MNRAFFNPRQIKDLPECLRKELFGYGAFDKLIEVFKQGGGVLNIDEVLVGFYKCFGECRARLSISGYLYRAKRRGIVSPTGKTGEYKLLDEFMKED